MARHAQARSVGGSISNSQAGWRHARKNGPEIAEQALPQPSMAIGFGLSPMPVAHEGDFFQGLFLALELAPRSRHRTSSFPPQPS
jgi:hypothetical protein